MVQWIVTLPYRQLTHITHYHEANCIRRHECYENITSPTYATLDLRHTYAYVPPDQGSPLHMLCITSTPMQPMNGKLTNNSNNILFCCRFSFAVPTLVCLLGTFGVLVILDAFYTPSNGLRALHPTWQSKLLHMYLTVFSYVYYSHVVPGAVHQGCVPNVRK